MQVYRAINNQKRYKKLWLKTPFTEQKLQVEDVKNTALLQTVLTLHLLSFKPFFLNIAVTFLLQ